MTAWNRPAAQRGDRPIPEPYRTLIEFTDGTYYVVPDKPERPHPLRPYGSVIVGLDDCVTVHWRIDDENGERIGSASVRWPMHYVRAVKHTDAGWHQWGPRDH